jgi:hypothetical protein
MSKVIRVLVLGVALACPVFADDIPYGVNAAGNIPNNATVADDIPYGVTLVTLLRLILA